MRSIAGLTIFTRRITRGVISPTGKPVAGILQLAEREEERRMNTYKVIEGTVWEIQAETLEGAKAIYEAYFNGSDEELPMQEREGSSYWYAEGEAELEQVRATVDGVAFNAGAVSALEWLEEVYGTGIHGTGAWAEHIGKVEGCECEWCDSEEEAE